MHTEIIAYFRRGSFNGIQLTPNLAVDVVSIAKPAELLLTGSIPAVEDNGPMVGVEWQRVHIDTERS